MAAPLYEDDVHVVRIEPDGLEGLLGIPPLPRGLIIFAHGSGSSRLSPRNLHVASLLRRGGFATLLIDLLRPEEETDRTKVFDIALLAAHLASATRWAVRHDDLQGLPIGYFGASTGAAAALVAAAELGDGIGAVVSRGGRPDLAGLALAKVRAPTLLIVGGADSEVIGLNRTALARLTCESNLVVVPRAGHLFEEPGALDDVVLHAERWFHSHLGGGRFGGDILMFEDRRDAGRQLAAQLMPYRETRPVILALPRGGVPVGFEVSEGLDAPLDVVLVRKIGAPSQPELGIGAVVDGAHPQLVLNEDVARMVHATDAYIEAEKKRQLIEIERRRDIYGNGRPPLSVDGRTAIVVDDGIATGGTMKAVLRALARSHPERLVLAVPVAPRDSLEELAAEADEIVCLATPEPFHAVGMHYRDFTQTTDGEVLDLLQQAAHRLEGGRPASSPRERHI